MLVPDDVAHHRDKKCALELAGLARRVAAVFHWVLQATRRPAPAIIRGQPTVASEGELYLLHGWLCFFPFSPK